jgi:3-methyl-2-oxobutanoate hydroxymethyltransferase
MKTWTVATFAAAKGQRKLGCCTAYDACFARLADEAGVPCLLVGDSMGMTMLGYETTLPVRMEETLSATAAVARAVKQALVVADLPFGSYQCGDDAAMANAMNSQKFSRPRHRIATNTGKATVVTSDATDI